MGCNAYLTNHCAFARQVCEKSLQEEECTVIADAFLKTQTERKRFLLVLKGGRTCRPLHMAKNESASLSFHGSSLPFLFLQLLPVASSARS